MNRDMVFSYTRDLLEQMTGSRPEIDSDGDLLIEFGGAAFYVRVVSLNDPIVQIFSVVLADLEPTPELYGAVNRINSDLNFARAFHVNNQFLIESEIWGADLNMANFAHACGNIARASDAIGNTLLEEFGGKPRFEMSKQENYAPSVNPKIGFYL